jgi:hypothetical protein
LQLHIGRMDLVIEGSSEDCLALRRCYGRTESAARIEHGIIYTAESQFCEGKVDRAQLRRDDRKLYG